jgi:hypothetical protein
MWPPPPDEDVPEDAAPEDEPEELEPPVLIEPPLTPVPVEPPEDRAEPRSTRTLRPIIAEDSLSSGQTTSFVRLS